MATNTATTTMYIKTTSPQPGNWGWEHRPQQASMTAGSMLLIAGGLNYALGLGWSSYTDVPVTEQIRYSFFIGASVGALLSALLIRFVPNRILIGLGGLLTLATGIIFTSAPSNYDAILAARYISGFAVGWITLAMLIHASEIAYKNVRGGLLSFEQYSLCTGIAVQIIAMSQWYDVDFLANRMIGILIIVLSVIGLCAVVFIRDSPVYHLRNNNESAALESLVMLRLPQTVSNSTQVQLEELKVYVRDNESMDLAQALAQTLTPFIKVLLYRGMLALTLSLPLSTIFLYAEVFSGNNWAAIVYGVLRFLGAFIGLLILDPFGRKLTPAIAMLCMGGMTLGIGIIASSADNLSNTHQLAGICAMSLIMQLFAGIYAPSTSAYLGESMPLKLKPYAIALCLTVEYVIHIVVICVCPLGSDNVAVYCIISAIIMFVMVLGIMNFMPETRNTNLSESQSRFQMFLYVKVI